jgi:hypothetical protein
VPTAAPWAGVACRGSRDGRPHRPQPKPGHQSRHPGKPARSVRRSLSLPFLCSSAGSTFASKGGKNHTWPPTAQTTGLDRVSDPGIAARSPEPGIRCGRTPRGRAAPVIDGRQRDTSWPTLITSSGRHIMRRSMRQAPSAASTWPPHRTAAPRALSTGFAQLAVLATHHRAIGDRMFMHRRRQGKRPVLPHTGRTLDHRISVERVVMRHVVRRPSSGNAERGSRRGGWPAGTSAKTIRTP